MHLIDAFLFAALVVFGTGSVFYLAGKRHGREGCARAVRRGERYADAVDNLDRWCGHESPAARLIAAHLKAEGEGLPMNAGTPAFDEVCTISGLREQLRRLEAAGK